LGKSLFVFNYLQLMFGDLVISVETAARQAEERGHKLIDEIRALLVGAILFQSSLACFGIFFWLL
jgi:hypothetical protein